MKTRLDRRLRLEKEKRKAVRLIRTIWQRPDLASDPAFVGKRARTRVPCSCIFCGNLSSIRGRFSGTLKTLRTGC